MKPVTLAEEVLAVLPSLMAERPHGPSIRAIAVRLGADDVNVRGAARQLNTEAKADLYRRTNSREQFLVPFRCRNVVGLRYCANCNKTFAMPPRKKIDGGSYYSNRRCCTRACGIAWSWNRPGVRQRRSAGIKTAHNTPEQRARLDAHNKRRWSRPGEREKLSEQNRREWKDPVKAALRAQSIKAVNGSPEKRKFYSDMRKAFWRDPAMRAKMIAAATKAKSTPEYRAYFSELCRQRWRDPVWRKKWMPAVKRNAALGASALKGKKQSAAQIAARVDATKRTKATKLSISEAT